MGRYHEQGRRVKCTFLRSLTRAVDSLTLRLLFCGHHAHGEQRFMSTPNQPVRVYEKHVFVCTSGKICPHQGSVAVHARLKSRAKEVGLQGRVRVNNSGCLDQCGNGPMIVIYPEEVWYSCVTLEDVEEIVQEHLLNDRPVERLLYDGSGKDPQRMEQVLKGVSRDG